MVQYLFRDNAESIRHDLEVEGFKNPHGRVIERARMRLDMASMLWHRHQCCNEVDKCRFVGVDASRQRGLEIFCARAFTCSAARPSEWCMNTFPPILLGYGRVDLFHKCMSFVHLIFLLAGPTESTMRAYCETIVAVVTDCGTEMGIADYPDIISAYFGGGMPSSPLFLFPNAWLLPGFQHLVDTCLKKALQQLPFWPQFLETLKIVSRFLHDGQHRDKLRARLPAGRKADHKTLKRTVRSMAQWRWGTLWSSMKDVDGMLPLLQELWNDED